MTLTMVAPFWFSALTMVAGVDDDGCISSGSNFWYMHVGCMIVVKCDTCKIFGAYAQLACIATNIVGIILVLGRACRSLILIFRLFNTQLKTNLWIIWHHKLKLLLSAKYS